MTFLRLIKLTLWMLACGAGSLLSAQNTGKPIVTNQTEPPTNNQAIAQSTPLPQLMLLPWQTPTIDADTLSRTSKTRDAMLQQLKEAWLPTSKTLDTMAPKNPAWETARPSLKSIWAETQTSAVTSPTAILPLWTHVHDHDVFALVIIDSLQNTIRSITHRVIPRSKWQLALKDGSYKNYFQPVVSELQKAINLSSIKNANADMSVAFRDQTASANASEMDRNTLAMLLAAPWLGDFTVINPFATEQLTAIHGFYNQKNSMRRANREIITRLTYDKAPKLLKLPITVMLNIGATDGVFGQTLPWSWSEPLSIGVNGDNTINLKYSEKLKTTLTTESASLRRDELPQVVKIRGAWAYVDKGRAWGLQMNDRLVSNDDPNKIKGHVVSYYGPEMKLSSGRGWPIHEGAIIFIRKGQKDVRVGQTLTYDGMKVPTPWPPNTSPPGSSPNQ
jgi:hypothetical protein